MAACNRGCGCFSFDFAVSEWTLKPPEATCHHRLYWRSRAFFPGIFRAFCNTTKTRPMFWARGNMCDVEMKRRLARIIGRRTTPLMMAASVTPLLRFRFFREERSERAQPCHREAFTLAQTNSALDQRPMPVINAETNAVIARGCRKVGWQSRGT